MSTWQDRMFKTIPPVTKQAGREVVTRTVFEPNVIVDSGTVLGSWDLGISSFSKAKSAKSTIPLSGKGRVVSVDIRHQEDTPHALLGVGFIYKTKKP